MVKDNLEFMNTSVLAYLGDAVYEVYVRRFVIETGQVHAGILHHAAVRYVKAQAQAEALKRLFPELTETEQAVVKRARNKKITSKPKNADPVEYKWATALEALIGYLYLTNHVERMESIIETIFTQIGVQNGREKST